MGWLVLLSDTMMFCKENKQSSIKRKLMEMGMVTSIIAVLLTCTLFVAYGIMGTRKSVINELLLASQMINNRAGAALVWGDRETAQQSLDDLKVKNSIRVACIYDQTGHIYGSYLSDTKSICPDSSLEGIASIGWQKLSLYHSISFNDRTVGTLYIESDIRDITKEIPSYVGFAIILLSGISGIAYIISSYYQRLIAKPILHLEETAHLIINLGQYNIRATKFDNDEVGRLADRFNDMLSVVQERDNALKMTVAKLEKSNQDLEHATKLKELWISNIGHEIRTPIHGILQISHYGVLECEKEKPDISSFSNFFSRLYKSGVRLGKLIEGLLDFQKMKTGKYRIHFQETDIVPLIQEVIEELHPFISEKEIQIQWHPITCSTVFSFDGDNIYHVISNIIGNAIKFSPHCGTIDISVTSSPLDESKPDGVSIAIKDNGVGIPEGEEEAIFDTFTQSSKTYNGSGGTGLGLSIAREMVLLHHGRIFAKNNNGEEGATFIFILPRTQEMVNSQ